MPAPSKPKSAINNPIPTEIALLILTGIESTIASLILKPLILKILILLIIPLLMQIDKNIP